MDKRVLEFYCQNEYLKKCHEEGKDIYSSFASKLFGVDYEDCQEWKNGEPYLPGKARRDAAKSVLCAWWCTYSGEESAMYWLDKICMS
jgi:hypothetical protein